MLEVELEIVCAPDFLFLAVSETISSVGGAVRTRGFSGPFRFSPQSGFGAGTTRSGETGPGSGTKTGPQSETGK